MAVEEQEFSVEVEASQAECFKAILDFERYPEWSSAIQKVAVLERDAQGVGKVVEFRIDMKFKSIRYVLDYRYRKPSQLTWHSVDGDVESINGAYKFEKIDADRTNVTCRQAISIGFWVPGPVRKLLERTALRQSVMEFKADVEKRRAGAKTGKSKKRA